MTSTNGLAAHYKVRIVMCGGAMLHLATERAPGEWWPTAATGISELLHTAGLIHDYRYGDTPGYLDDRQIAAVTWRYTPAAEPKQ